jgi:hypothetical protein
LDDIRFRIRIDGNAPMFEARRTQHTKSDIDPLYKSPLARERRCRIVVQAMRRSKYRSLAIAADEQPGEL